MKSAFYPPLGDKINLTFDLFSKSPNQKLTQISLNFESEKFKSICREISQSDHRFSLNFTINGLVESAIESNDGDKLIIRTDLQTIFIALANIIFENSKE